MEIGRCDKCGGPVVNIIGGAVCASCGTYSLSRVDPKTNRKNAGEIRLQSLPPATEMPFCLKPGCHLPKNVYRINGHPGVWRRIGKREAGETPGAVNASVKDGAEGWWFGRLVLLEADVRLALADVLLATEVPKTEGVAV